MQPLAVERTSRDGVELVLVEGEVDIASASRLISVLNSSVADAIKSVIVDLSDCSFMDSTGLHLLTRTQQRFDSAGGRVAVVSANRGVLRVFGSRDSTRSSPIYPSRAAALNGDSYH